MTGLERVRRAIRGESIDHIPTFPIMIAPACQIAGVPQGRYSQDPSVLAATLLEIRERFDFDGIYVSRDNWVFHQAFGGTLLFPEDDEPYATAPLLDSPAGFERLALPDPERAPGMRDLLAAARTVVREDAGLHYVQANIDVGPFSLAAELMGLERFLLAAATEERGVLSRFLDFCTDAVVAYARAMIATGVHGVQYGDACASLVSPEMYRELVLPYQERTVAELSGLGCDLWIHICGKTDHLLPLVATLAIDGFEVDAKVDLAQARRLIGERIALKGNLDTTFLLERSADEVYAETRRALDGYARASGLIYSPGCGVPRMTPEANLHAMVRACRDHPCG